MNWLTAQKAGFVYGRQRKRSAEHKEGDGGFIIFLEHSIIKKHLIACCFILLSGMYYSLPEYLLVTLVHFLCITFLLIACFMSPCFFPPFIFTRQAEKRACSSMISHSKSGFHNPRGMLLKDQDPVATVWLLQGRPLYSFYITAHISEPNLSLALQLSSTNDLACWLIQQIRDWWIAMLEPQFCVKGFSTALISFKTFVSIELGMAVF